MERYSQDFIGRLVYYYHICSKMGNYPCRYRHYIRPGRHLSQKRAVVMEMQDIQDTRRAGLTSDKIWIARDLLTSRAFLDPVGAPEDPSGPHLDLDIFFPLSMACRHGLITGATGTGKTTTLKVLAEGLSDAGIPVFLCDIKGDLSGLCQPGRMLPWIQNSMTSFGLAAWPFLAYPVTFWDVYQEDGIPIRATIESMGPMLIARMLDMSSAQSDVLDVIFKIAKDRRFPLISTLDLANLIEYCTENCKTLSREYGYLPTQTLAAIHRGVTKLGNAGADDFFGLPPLDVLDLIGKNSAGRGKIGLLNCVELAQNPLLYSVFLLWFLSELYAKLPEVGNLQRPKIVLFFDESHLIFSDASRALVQKIERIVRLIRSKGVGVYFISQSPADIPDPVLAQLGNKIQHALRAYTPKDQRAVRVAAKSLRENPDFKTFDMIGNLGTGEALISLLGDDGIPCPVRFAKVIPPRSLDGVADPDYVYDRIRKDPLFAKYWEDYRPKAAAIVPAGQMHGQEEAGQRADSTIDAALINVVLWEAKKAAASLAGVFLGGFLGRR
jgi:Cdc6-like AAA superfamily ATPase